MKVKYVLYRGDSGYGNMGEYNTKEVGYFTTLGKVVDFFQRNKILVDYNNKMQDFDIGVKFRVQDQHQGLGSMDYWIEAIEKPNLKTDPVTLKDLFK